MKIVNQNNNNFKNLSFTSILSTNISIENVKFVTPKDAEKIMGMVQKIVKIGANRKPGELVIYEGVDFTDFYKDFQRWVKDYRGFLPRIINSKGYFFVSGKEADALIVKGESRGIETSLARKNSKKNGTNSIKIYANPYRKLKDDLTSELTLRVRRFFNPASEIYEGDEIVLTIHAIQGENGKLNINKDNINISPIIPEFESVPRKLVVGEKPEMPQKTKTEKREEKKQREEARALKRMRELIAVRSQSGLF